MTNTTWKNEGLHAHYVTKPIVELDAFKKGECFICKEKIIEHPDAFCHLGCALAYENAKKEFIDDFFKKKGDKDI